MDTLKREFENPKKDLNLNGIIISIMESFEFQPSAAFEFIWNKKFRISRLHVNIRQVSCCAHVKNCHVKIVRFLSNFRLISSSRDDVSWQAITRSNLFDLSNTWSRDRMKYHFLMRL